MKADIQSTAEHRLATYGTLAPGRVNHHQLAGLEGTWFEGKVRGRLVQDGWGADLGYPGMIPDEVGEEIDVFVFESADLPDHWARLDAFEGAGYARIPIKVSVDGVDVWASIYCLATDTKA